MPLSFSVFCFASPANYLQSADAYQPIISSPTPFFHPTRQNFDYSYMLIFKAHIAKTPPPPP
ncbi:979_t:CDS:2, partial [Gigaspora rosea]